MQIQETIEKDTDWSIEIGRSTWADGASQSIRSRHVLRPGNGFSPRSSPELPVGELPELVAALMASPLVGEDLKERLRAAVR